MNNGATKEGSKGMKKRKKLENKKYGKVNLSDAWMDLFIRYNELWQLNNSNRISPELSNLFESLTNDLEDTYKFITATLGKRIREGDTKPISIILTAIGSNALDLNWFIESLKFLLNKRKRVLLQIPKNKNFNALLKELRQFEKRLNRGKTMAEATYSDAPSATLKTRYYRDLDDFLLIFILRYTFIFLHPSPHKLAGRFPSI